MPKQVPDEVFCKYLFVILSDKISRNSEEVMRSQKGLLLRVTGLRTLETLYVMGKTTSKK
jgi:hypothetical protein